MPPAGIQRRTVQSPWKRISQRIR